MPSWPSQQARKRVERLTSNRLALVFRPYLSWSPHAVFGLAKDNRTSRAEGAWAYAMLNASRREPASEVRGIGRLNA